jgi:hypothetical protein
MLTVYILLVLCGVYVPLKRDIVWIKQKKYGRSRIEWTEFFFTVPTECFNMW